MMKSVSVISLACLLIVAGCGKGSSPQANATSTAGTTGQASTTADASTSSSGGASTGATAQKQGIHTLTKLITKDIKVGDGIEQGIKVKNNAPVKGDDLVTLLYTGKLADGTVFDSNVPKTGKQTQPLVFLVGHGFVVPGFDQGVIGMRIGGEREIDIPARLGYGSQSRDPIPPNSDLHFDVKLLDIVRPGEEGYYDYKDLAPGSGSPIKDGDTVQIQYTGKFTDGQVFDSNVGKEPFEFTIGNQPPQVISGMEAGVKGMKKGGERLLRLPPAIAYGTRKVPGIPPNSTLIFDIKVLNVM